MKKLLLLILFSSHFAWAEDTSNHSPRMPPKAELMVKAFPHTFYATLACFNYPKINIKACEQIAEVDHPGSSYAKHNLGYANEMGKEGFKQSYTDAFYWYLRAANQGLDSSLHNLARMYEFGLGVQVSHEMAYRLYRKADNSSWHGHKASFDRAAILTLVKLNREVEKGITPYETKLEFMSLLEPWQIKEANNYFD